MTLRQGVLARLSIAYTPAEREQLELNASTGGELQLYERRDPLGISPALLAEAARCLRLVRAHRRARG